MTGRPPTELTRREARRLEAAMRERDRADEAYRSVLRELVGAGKAGAVARELGISRQAVHKAAR